HARRREGAALARPPLSRGSDLHAAPRPGLGRPGARVSRDPHLLRPASARGGKALSPLPAAVSAGGRIARPRWLRSRLLELALRRQGRAPRPGRAPPQLL